jgi:hypothetical protein
MVEQTKMVEMEEGGIIIRQLTSKKDLRRVRERERGGDQEMTQIYLKQKKTRVKEEEKKSLEKKSNENDH